ncbi:MAG: tetratricopeptide repeat protein, partial [Rhizobiaceae bacterium]|nr:tetratricopeptide repeat protein [Rhizobiaceae bacterium]
VAAALGEASDLLAAGDAGEAAEVFAAVLQHDAESLPAIAGLAECYLAMGDAARARAVLDHVPAAKADDPTLQVVRTKLKLAEEIAALGDERALLARLDADEDDHQARFDLALIAQAKGDRAAAADGLLDIVRRSREWNEDGARKKLLEFFEVWGGGDPATKDARRKLSTLLFS